MSGVQNLLASGILGQVLLALAVGIVIGMEQEFRGKAAGLRPMTLICLGTTLFTIFSLRLPGNTDPSRIAASIVAGIGFVGAGVIIQQGRHIKGLTTAATIWLVAALGMGIGAHYEGLVLLVTLIVLGTLWGFPRLEKELQKWKETRVYTVTLPNADQSFERIDKLWQENDLRVTKRKITKNGDERICMWRVTGKLESHTIVFAILLNQEEVHQIRY